jgi:hypothetical protein
MAVGVATMGRMARVRSSPRPQNWRLKSRAMARPRMVSAPTATMVK